MKKICGIIKVGLGTDTLMCTPIDQLPLSTRTTNRLRQLKEEGETVLLRDVVSRTEVELLQIYGFGRASLREVQSFLWLNKVWHKDNILLPECEKLWWK